MRHSSSAPIPFPEPPPENGATQVEPMKTNPIFSVILPTYNHGQYIEKAIRSVLTQTFGDLELIIIDNHSTDDTEKIVEDFAAKDSRLRYFKIHNHGSIAKSRNFGIAQSHGVYMSFLDSDDSWFSGKLQAVLAAFSQHPNIDVVYHSELETRQNGKKLLMRHRLMTGNCYVFLALHGNPLVTSATTVRKSTLLQAGGFSEEKKVISAEDYDLWLNLAAQNANFYHIKEVLGEYRRHAGSISSSALYHCTNCFNVSAKHFKKLLDLQLITPDEYANHLFYQMVQRDYIICRKLFSEKKFLAAIKQQCESLKTWELTVNKIFFLISWFLKKRLQRFSEFLKKVHPSA